MFNVSNSRKNLYLIHFVTLKIQSLYQSYFFRTPPGIALKIYYKTNDSRY